MKKIIYIISVLILLIVSDSFSQHHGDNLFDGKKEKSPAIAALLSIQPFPVAAGNFYSGNWERGLIYTTVELALFIPASILFGRHHWNWGMHDYDNFENEENYSWTESERNRFYYFLAGYLVVKIISAFDAGYSAELYNQNLSIGYDVQTNSAVLGIKIPIN